MTKAIIWILCFLCGFAGSRFVGQEDSAGNDRQSDGESMRSESEWLARDARKERPPEESLEESLEEAIAMSPGPERRRLLGKALNAYPETDPNKLLELVEDIGVLDLDTRSKPSAHMTEKLLMPTEAPGMGFWNTGVSSADTYGSRIRDFIKGVAKESPRAALHWLAKVDVPHEHTLFQQLLTETLDLWAEEEPSTVDAWKRRFDINIVEEVE